MYRYVLQFPNKRTSISFSSTGIPNDYGTGTKIDKTNKPFIVKQKCVPVPIISKVDKQTISFHEIKKWK